MDTAVKEKIFLRLVVRYNLREKFHRLADWVDWLDPDTIADEDEDSEMVIRDYLIHKKMCESHFDPIPIHLCAARQQKSFYTYDDPSYWLARLWHARGEPLVLASEWQTATQSIFYSSRSLGRVHHVVGVFALFS
jgi:hypothetical protein